MRAFRCLVACICVLVVLASGCGGDANPGAEGQDEPLVVSVVRPPADPNAPLPTGACFVATRGLEVVLLAEEGARPGFCERLDRYLPGSVARATWPPHLGEEEALQAACRVAQEGVAVDISGVVRNGGPEPLDVCAAMIDDGWELRPLEEDWGETLVEETQPGTCFVATARYELEMFGYSGRGQALCDDLAQQHLRAPVTYRSLPVPDDPGLLADVVCEASRGAETISVLRTPGVPGKLDAAAVCRSLARDDWKIAR